MHARHQRMKRDDKFAKRVEVNDDKLDDVLEKFGSLAISIKVGCTRDAMMPMHNSAANE